MADSRRVLILDDDAMVGGLIETVARIDGATTKLTAHPTEFLDALPDWAPTHLVIDLTLPGMSGEDVLRRVGTVGCSARVVLTSGVEPVRLEAAGRLAQDLGLQLAGTMSKPFRPASLRALLA